MCKLSAALSPVFGLCASFIKRGVLAGAFLSFHASCLKKREFDIISHAGVSLFTWKDTGLSFETNLWISNASTQERGT